MLEHDLFIYAKLELKRIELLYQQILSCVQGWTKADMILTLEYCYKLFFRFYRELQRFGFIKIYQRKDKTSRWTLIFIDSSDWQI